MAHYERMRQVINLTKMRGAGSLAHEWWHGLDDYMGKQMRADGFLSESPHRHPLIEKLVNTIKYRPETPEEAAERIESRDAETLKYAEQWLEHAVFRYLKEKGNDESLEQYAALKAAYLRGEAGSVEQLNDLKKAVCGRVIPKDERETLLSYGRFIRSMKEIPTEPTLSRVITDYYHNSKKMGRACEKDGGYWDSNVELTARAFATYVMDRLPHKSD